MAATKRFSARAEGGDDAEPTLCAAIAAAHDFAGEAGLDPRLAARLAIVVEELVSNVLRHGAAAAIDMLLERHEGTVRLVLEDDGARFDLRDALAAPGPDPVSGGGVGLEMVKAWANIRVYVREGNANRLELELRALPDDERRG